MGEHAADRVYSGSIPTMAYYTAYDGMVTVASTSMLCPIESNQGEVRGTEARSPTPCL
jgi:hypothetical protein